MIAYFIAALLLSDPCDHTIRLNQGDVVPCGPVDGVPPDRGQWLLACRTKDLPGAQLETALCEAQRARDVDALRLRLDDAERRVTDAERQRDEARLRELTPPDAPSVWASPVPWVMLAVGAAAAGFLALALGP